MTHKTTAEALLIAAQEEKRSTIERIYQQQVRALRWKAAGALNRVINPWWRDFTTSKEAAQIRVLLSTRHLLHLNIAHRVRYIREDGREWEAQVQIVGQPLPSEFVDAPVRDLELRVAQFPEGRAPSGHADGYFIHRQRRDFPTGRLDLLRSDLHPIIVIDFAEQIQNYTVTSLIENFIAETLRVNA